MTWATVPNSYHSVIRLVRSSGNHEHEKTHIYIDTHIHIYIHCLYILALIHTYTYIQMYTHMHTHTFTCKHTLKHMHAHTYTHTDIDHSHMTRGHRTGFQPCRFRFNCLRVSSGHWYLKTSSASLRTSFTPVT